MDFLGLRISSTIGGCISTNYLLAGIGTVGAIVLISQLLRNSKPFLVATTKEFIAFQQWLNSNIEESKEFWEDIVAEAKHEYKLEVERKLEILQKQQEILEKIKASL
ncbi:MAG: hypothetical protein ACP5G3_04465 [Sulfurihydrogenibium sp.]|jgi:hypothetical protein|uniref:Uncharacterized protein n=1 Tax=Sulfurihydrogenibium azorense TaxID=309806 RepID=A0A831YC79_9AQUI|nr:MAG: hypothetical protein C0178_02840 [Sulfurihydrogenibium sp.]HEV08827.1 hypothetical protein [Sulfurihydrogenibium azorense]